MDDNKETFYFELCSCPPALFDKSCTMREHQKSVLTEAMWSKFPPDLECPSVEVQYVLDGGALLHRIPWPRGFPKYWELCLLYSDYVSWKYGQATIVFDGYQKVSTKYSMQW